ncbi:MAG TPA: hypothetical protein VH331_13280 [Allosphingosinicella sp.]|nr:hypothetical protein [Allosphingosinicella sp.]
MLYAFRDEGGGELVCGIAVYGFDAAKIERRLRARIAADRDFAPMPSNDSRSSHWRLAKAEGMGGIDLVRRAPSRNMPALEAERHQILVH